MDSAGWKNALKYLSIIYMIIDVAFIVVYALSAASVFSADTVFAIMGIDESLLGGVDVSGAITLLSVSAIVSYLINFVFTFFVYRGAKDPSKMKPGMIMYGILSVIAVWGLITNIAGGTLSGVALGQYIITWFIFFAAVKVSKMA